MTGETHTIYTDEGVWEIRRGSPIPWEDGMEYAEALRAAGYSRFTAVGSGSHALTCYRRTGEAQDKPEFMIDFDTDDACVSVFVESFPNVMELLTEWTPFIRDAHIVGMLENLGSYEESPEAKKYWTLGQLIRDSLR